MNPRQRLGGGCNHPQAMGVVAATPIGTGGGVTTLGVLLGWPATHRIVRIFFFSKFWI